MRKLFTILVAVLLTATVWAQAPQKMSYQAVIRDAGGNLVTSQVIGMEINIRQGSSSGTIVYTETQMPTTNVNGLVSLEIGGGAGFNAIDWANNNYYIETRTAVVAPLTTYTIAGVSQLLSVPYALNAKTSENGITTAQANEIAANTLKVGITAQQASDITANNAKVGITTVQADAIAANTLKVGITAQQASDIIANNAKVGITTVQADAITANTAKVGITGVQTTKLAGIADDAEVNVQADWNQATNTADDYIKNKPTIPTAADGSETKVTAGTNVNVTGAGTTASPYVINSTAGHYLGEEYLGGIIFNLYTTSDGTQHGLIVSKTETTATWSGSSLVGADRTEDGAYNMNLMLTGAGTARTWVETLGAGWYLPSIDELSILWHSRYYVNKTARAISSTLLSTTAYYWSSTEANATTAFFFFSINGYNSSINKTNTYSVRAVRAF